MADICIPPSFSFALCYQFAGALIVLCLPGPMPRAVSTGKATILDDMLDIGGTRLVKGKR